MVVTTSQSPQQGDPSNPTTYGDPRNGYPAPRHGGPRHAGGPQHPPHVATRSHPAGGPARNTAAQNPSAQNWTPQGYGAAQPAVPQQWGPGGPAAQPTGWGPVPVAAPRNGVGIAALCLGIVGILFGLVPFTGFIAFALGAIGLILGLVGLARARKKVATNRKTAISGTVLSVIAIALGIWGMVIVFTGLNQLAEELNSIPSASATAPGTGTVTADLTTPYTAGPTSYKLDVTGDAEKMTVGYGAGASSSFSPEYQTLPWSKTVEVNGDASFASLNATSFGPGSITCTITDVGSGQVVATQTSRSLDDSEYGSASVSCSTLG